MLGINAFPGSVHRGWCPPQKAAGFRLSILSECYSAVVVAVAVVLVVQVAVDQVVDMIAVGNGFVTAIGTVNMAGIVTGTLVTVAAISGIVSVYIQSVLIDMVAVQVMQVTIVQVVNMIAMLDSGVTAIGAVCVIVIIVGIARHGCQPPRFYRTLQ